MCRNCRQPIRRCPYKQCFCTGWHHIPDGLALCDVPAPPFRLPAYVADRIPDALIEGPSYEWRREALAEGWLP